MAKPSRYLAVLTAMVAMPLLAAPADDVKIRIAGLREMGAAFKAVNDGLRAGEPQTMLIQLSARQIVNASRAQYRWFPAGSGNADLLRAEARKLGGTCKVLS